ncbi:hypothetical protein AVEN_272456-1, partial [Araneus ventricosus]
MQPRLAPDKVRHCPPSGRPGSPHTFLPPLKPENGCCSPGNDVTTATAGA